jgi:hypothetical protein
MHRLEVPMPNAMPFAIGTFDTIGPMSRADFPHRHTFYEIVHVTAGTGAHVVDLARRELRPPHLGVIAPGQVHHWEGARGLAGSVVLFTEDFLLDHPGDRELLRSLGERPWRDLDGPAHERTARLIADLDDEYRTGAEGFAGVLRALLHVLVVRAARLPGPAPARPPSRPGAVAAEFLRLIHRNDPALWSVSGCADRIGVSGGGQGGHRPDPRPADPRGPHPRGQAAPGQDGSHGAAGGRPGGPRRSGVLLPLLQAGDRGEPR